MWYSVMPFEVGHDWLKTNTLNLHRTTKITKMSYNKEVSNKMENIIVIYNIYES